MQIENLNEKNAWDVASFCLQNAEQDDWWCEGDKDRIEEAWRKKHEFLISKIGEGARAKIAYAKGGPVGFIEYYPIDITNLELVGEKVMVIWCINVKEEYRSQDIGTQLLKTCLTDVKSLGYKGAAVTCWDPFWMPSSFFEKHGFSEVGEGVGNGTMLFYSLDKIDPPIQIGRGSIYDEFKAIKEKVVLDIFHTNRCPIHWRNTALVKSTAKEFGEQVIVREYNTDSREAMLKHEIAYSIYLDGQIIGAGPPINVEKIRSKIQNLVSLLQ